MENVSLHENLCNVHNKVNKCLEIITVTAFPILISNCISEHYTEKVGLGGVGLQAAN